MQKGSEFLNVLSCHTKGPFWQSPDSRRVTATVKYPLAFFLAVNSTLKPEKDLYDTGVKLFCST